ncbi:MAG: MlaD family protein [Solirubrobacteraceae bacterium]
MAAARARQPNGASPPGQPNGARPAGQTPARAGERRRPARLAGPIALIVAAAALAVVLVGSRSTYVLHAQFSDAGQLVQGDLVTVGGHKVGSVGPITLTRHGLADVQLNIDDPALIPLRRGTMATIGQTSLTGLANRFVGLSPGAGAPIKDGSVLPTSQTRGIVDLDTLLNTFTPRVRASVQGLLRAGAYLVGQPTAAQFNEALRYFNGALSQSTQLTHELAVNRTALSALIASTAHVSTALAAHSQQLAGAVHETAVTLSQVATQRSALGDAISRAPRVLDQATRVLGHVRGTLVVLDPALRHLRPVATRVGSLLTAVRPAAANVVPTIRALDALLPGAEAALERFPAVERVATPAVRSLTQVLRLIAPSLSALRPYGPDVVAGFFNGVGGADAGSYDANGHYLHGEATVQGGGSSLTGLLNLLGGLLGGQTGTVGPFHGARTHLLAPCPGGGGPPAADRSNPWIHPDTLPAISALCKPAHDQR